MGCPSGQDPAPNHALRRGMPRTPSVLDTGLGPGSDSHPRSQIPVPRKRKQWEPPEDRTTDRSGEERAVPLSWRGEEGMLAWKAPCARAATGPVQVCGGCGGPQDIPRVTGDGRWLARAASGTYQCPRGGERPAPWDIRGYKSSGMEGAVLRCVERGAPPTRTGCSRCYLTWL